MKTGTAILIGGGLFIGYKAVGLARLANAGDRLKVDPAGVDVLGVSNSAIQFRLQLVAANPTSQPLRLDGVYLDVGVPSAGQVARIRAGANELKGFQSIAANQVTRIAIPFEVGLISLALTGGSTLVTALTTGQLPKEASITGEVKVNGIPVAYDQRIPIRRASA